MLSLYVAYRVITGLITIFYLYGRVQQQQTNAEAAKAVMNAPVPVELQKGLVLYYSFDKDNGAVVLDDSGHGNTGVVRHAVYTPEGHVGGAYEFDGRACIDLGDAAVGQGHIRSSWCAWVYPTDKAQRGIMGKSRGDDMVFSFLVEPGQREVRVRLKPPVEPDLRGLINKGHIQLNRWQHLVFTYDGELFWLYHNGNQVWHSPLYVLNPMRRNHVGFAIGDIGVGSGQGFVGKIDEVRVYDRILASNEVLTLYNQAPVKK